MFKFLRGTAAAALLAAILPLSIALAFERPILLAERGSFLAGDSVKQEAGSGFVFPEGEVPPALETSSPFGALKGTPIALEDFNKLTKIPIIIYYGDYIPLEPTDEWNKDNWRVRLIMARQWAEAVNRHGGNAVVVHLPEIGIKGNTHFLFADLNNVEIADHMENWLIANKLR